VRVSPRHINAADEHDGFEVCRALAAADIGLSGQVEVYLAAHILCKVAS
jgi:hypothetical protein